MVGAGLQYFPEVSLFPVEKPPLTGETISSITRRTHKRNLNSSPRYLRQTGRKLQENGDGGDQDMDSIFPTRAPTSNPVDGSQDTPSSFPSSHPNDSSDQIPPGDGVSSGFPTFAPSSIPTLLPTSHPSLLDASGQPTPFPTSIPSELPSSFPSTFPTSTPTVYIKGGTIDQVTASVGVQTGLMWFTFTVVLCMVVLAFVTKHFCCGASSHSRPSRNFSQDDLELLSVESPTAGKPRETYEQYEKNYHLSRKTLQLSKSV